MTKIMTDPMESTEKRSSSFSSLLTSFSIMMDRCLVESKLRSGCIRMVFALGARAEVYLGAMGVAEKKATWVLIGSRLSVS
jgi:hypothetical protein